MTLTWCNHVDTSSPLTSTRADAIASEGSATTQNRNFEGDVGCCVEWINGGSSNSATFGSSGDGVSWPAFLFWVFFFSWYASLLTPAAALFLGAGLVRIDTESELNAVLNKNCGRVKIVDAINYCGSPASNILGQSAQERLVGGELRPPHSNTT